MPIYDTSRSSFVTVAPIDSRREGCQRAIRVRRGSVELGEAEARPVHVVPLVILEGVSARDVRPTVGRLGDATM